MVPARQVIRILSEFSFTTYITNRLPLRGLYFFWSVLPRFAVSADGFIACLSADFAYWTSEVFFMELRHLQSFIVVAEELSFTRAAARLHLTQPPLSRQIQALETLLGVRLLARGRSSQVTLTDAGRSFLADARRLLTAGDEAREHARKAAHGQQGKLVLANVAALSQGVVSPLLQAFRAQYPLVEIFLVELAPADRTAALREGRIHLGIYPEGCLPQDPQFESQGLYACPMVAVLPPGHPQANPAEAHVEMDIHALAGDTVLVPPPEAAPGYLERVDRACAAAKFTPAALHPVGGVPNLLGMVSAGYGVAILPEVLVGASVPAGQMRRLRAPVPPFRLSLIWSGAATSQALKNFREVATAFALQATRTPVRPAGNPSSVGSAGGGRPVVRRSRLAQGHDAGRPRRVREPASA